MNETYQVLTIALALTPFVSGITALFKHYTTAEGKLLPVITVIAGLVFGIVWAMVFGHIEQLPLYALAGLISGLSAGGFYNLVEPTKNKEDK